VSIDGTAVQLFDEPDIGDLYNWCPADDDHRVSPPSNIAIQGRTFEAEWDGLRVDVRVLQRADEPFFRLEGVIQNEREDHRLRLHVQLPNATDRAVAGAPFELVDRPLVGEGSSIETASPTWPARHVVMASQTAVLHEGVFEYEIVEGRDLAITLLRCVGAISKEKLATRPWPAGPGTPTPNAQMIGKTEFVLGVWPHAEQDALLRTWEGFALPIVDASARGGGALASSGSLMPVDGDVELSSVRRRDGERLITVWNAQRDRPVDAALDGRRLHVGAVKIALLRFAPSS
jgi:mannosylglycerate hydrolase